ncbi:MauE/DoxX family redox-associated membrane protein [Flavitalea sp.]|nr:MauE/DoxX family redox-associated membrane protein [Flavitalea sp.]
MKKFFISHFTDTAASLFIVLFLYTAVSKLLDYRSFYATMDIMPLLKGKGFILAPSIIVSEIIISFVLLIPALRVLGLYCSLALMSVFTIYLLFAVMSGYSLPCNCGGVLRQLSWKQHLLFNIAFVLVAISGIVSHLKQKHLLQ